jgi:hypothetical protein
MRLDVPVEMPAPKVRKTDSWERPEFFRGAHSSGKKFNEQIKNLSIYQQAYLQNKDKDKWSVSILDAAIKYASKVDRPVDAQYNSLFKNRALETNAPFDYILNDERLMKLMKTDKGVTAIGNGTVRLPNATLELFLGESAKETLPLNVFVLIATPQKFENAKTVFAQGVSDKGSTIQPTILQPKITINTLARPDEKTGVAADPGSVDPTKASEGDDADTVVIPTDDPSKSKSSAEASDPTDPTKPTERGLVAPLPAGMPPSEPSFEKLRTDAQLEREIKILEDRVVSLEDAIAQAEIDIKGYEDVLKETEEDQEIDPEIKIALEQNVTLRQEKKLVLALTKQKILSLKAKLDVQKIKYNRSDKPSRNLKLQKVLEYVKVTDRESGLIRQALRAKLAQAKKLQNIYNETVERAKQSIFDEGVQEKKELIGARLTEMLREIRALRQAEADALKAQAEAAALEAQEEAEAATTTPPPIQPPTSDTTAPADGAPRMPPSLVPRNRNAAEDDPASLDDSTLGDTGRARVQPLLTPAETPIISEAIKGSAEKQQKLQDLQTNRAVVPMASLEEDEEDGASGEQEPGGAKRVKIIELPQREVLDQLQTKLAEPLRSISIEAFTLSDPMQTPSLLTKLFKVLKEGGRGAPDKREIAKNAINDLYRAKLFAEGRAGTGLSTDTIINAINKINQRTGKPTTETLIQYENELAARVQPLYIGSGFMVGSGFAENMDSIVSASLIAEDAPNQQYLYVVHVR